MNRLTTISIKQFINKNIAYIFCILSAIIAVTICSKSSPIYPFNDWVDSNCYFTVGKSIFRGLVPYRDLIEQKGPFIYFIHALASLISYKTFLGVYFFELIGAFIFLYFSYKTLCLFCGEKGYLIIPFYALIVYTSKAFCHGDSAEELCFPFISYLIYIAFRTVQLNKQINKIEFLIIGIVASCVFWTKFTLCGIFLGWYIPFALDSLIHKHFKLLANSIIYIFLGVLFGTIPYLIYFGINNSIRNLIQIYIYNNLFLYSEVEVKSPSFYNSVYSLVKNLFYGYKDFNYNIHFGLYLLSFGAIYCILRKWFIQLIYAASMFITAFIFIFIGGRHYQYYSLGLIPMLCFGFVPIFIILNSENIQHNIFNHFTNLIYLLVFFSFFYLSKNFYMVRIPKSELPQYKFAKIISQTPNATLLNYGKLDIGLYTTTGIVPTCKYFCQLNIPLKEMYDTQNEYIKKGLCDYIVTYEDSDSIDNEKLKGDVNNLYELIDYTYFVFENIERKYSLYKLITD